MSCCGNNQTEPEEEDEELSGPMDDRSCTDVIFFILFAAFMVGMLFVFGVGLSRGNPGRVISGTDVAGDICGKDNVALEDVVGSGKNLEAAKFLYFDLLKTATILASQASDDVDPGLQEFVGSGLEGKSAREYCLPAADTVSAAPLRRAKDLASIALTPGMAEEDRQQVRRVSKKLETECRKAIRLKASSSVEEGKTGPSAHLEDLILKMTLNEELSPTMEYDLAEDDSTEKMRGLLISARLYQNKSALMVLLEPQRQGKMSVWRTSKLSAEDGQKLLDLNPVNVALTGGGACRYCVEACPEGYKNFLSRCLPEAATDQIDGAGELFSGSGAKSFFEDLMRDLQNCTPQMIQMGVVALVLSLIMTLLFRFLAGFIVYAIIGAVVVALVGGTVTLWVLWYFKNKDIGGDTSAIDNTVASVPGAADATEAVENSFLAESTKAKSEEEVMYFLIAAIVATVVLAVVLLVLLVLRKRIKLVIALFQEAGHAVHAMPLLVLVPLLTFVALAVTTAIWIYGSLWIFTAGDPVEDPETKFIKFTPDTFLWWMRWYHIFGFLWITQFLLACQHLVIAGSVAGWYFSTDKGNVGMTTMISAFYRLVRFHLGTAAFGSLIIAIIQMIRIILKYVEHHIKDWEKRGCTGPLLYIFKAFLKCAQCCLWCFEKCMKFINRNAYIETAIYGYNFCRAAMKAFQMLMANMMRVAAINSIGSFVLLLGKLAVVIATAAISYEIMRIKTETEYVEHVWAPILISTVFSLLTAHCFIEVYGMAIDTIFLCFCEDSSRNDGITKPYYMSKSMMEFVSNSDRALAALEKRKASRSESNEMLVQEKRPVSAGSLASIDD